MAVIPFLAAMVARMMNMVATATATTTTTLPTWMIYTPTTPTVMEQCRATNTLPKRHEKMFRDIKSNWQRAGERSAWRARNKKNKDTANNTYIAKGEVRVGSLDENAGSYGRWHHVRCWRVPKKICSGLTTTMRENTNKSDSTEEENQVLQELKSMEGILFSGLSELDGDSQKVIVRHVMDKENWAGSRRKKRKVEEESTNQEKQEEEEKEVAIVSSSTSITSGSASKAKVPIPVSSASDAEMRRRHEAARLAVLNDYSPSTKKKKKVEDAVVLVPPPTTAPIPTLFTVLLNPAEFQSIDKNILKGKCVCISGCFPEIMGGGVDGDGSNNNNEVVGVEAVKQVIVSLGGKVLKSVTKNVGECVFIHYVSF